MTFHDGGDLTTADVQATFQRILVSPQGFTSPRTPLFSAVEAITVCDPYTMTFPLRAARHRTFILGAWASRWNVMVRKKTLEDHNDTLLQVWNDPGTGPFRHVKRLHEAVWIVSQLR